MKVLIQGELYFEREHFQALLKEETYVRDRYRAVVLADETYLDIGSSSPNHGKAQCFLKGVEGVSVPNDGQIPR